MKFEVLTYLAMKRSVLFLAAAVLLGVGVWSCDREDNNEDNNSSVKWVDLGLPSGLLWADRTVGASSPEDYGNYDAWGETAPKEVYDWTTYAYGNYLTQLTKYCNDSDYGLNGFTDNLTTLQASDDAASANLGGKARTPTKNEWEELLSYTTSTWTTRNGVNGRLLTASNGKSLFLPAAGGRDGSGLVSSGEDGDYWSSALDTESPGYAWYFDFYSLSQGMRDGDRYYGLSVRAVRASQN